MKVVHFVPPFGGGIVAAANGLMSLPGVHVTPLDDLQDTTLVHCHHALRWVEAKALADRLGVPAVKTLHILQARQSRMRGLTIDQPTRSETLQLKAIHEASRLTIATHAAKAMLLEDHPTLPPERVGVVPFAPRLPRLPHTGDGPVVAVTRFDHLKGTDLLIDVVAAVLRDPAQRFVVAGGLPDNARADRRWREAFVAKLPPNAVPRLSFSGWLPPSALACVLASARAFVTTSRLETCGLGLMEAIAAGVPSVASDLPVHREVAPEATFVPLDAEAFAQALVDPRPPSRAAIAAPSDNDWLHFWAQTR